MPYASLRQRPLAKETLSFRRGGYLFVSFHEQRYERLTTHHVIRHKESDPTR